MSTVTTSEGEARRRRILVIRNPIAGRRRDSHFRQVVRAVEARGTTVVLQDTAGPGHARELAAAARRDAWDGVVAAGGDGTINEVVNGLGTEAPPLALIPLGTANVLALETGLGGTPEAIAEAIVGGPARRIHLGRADGRRFVMMTGIGFDAHVVANVGSRLKRRLGKGAFVLTALLGLLRFGFPTYRITLDGVVHEAASAVFANGRYYGGPMVCCPDARLDSPALQVCLFRTKGRLAVLRYGLALLRGRLDRLADVEMVPARRCSVEGPAGDPVQGDGEIIGRLPLEISLAEETLELVYPE